MLTYNITESIQLAVEHAVDMEDMSYDSVFEGKLANFTDFVFPHIFFTKPSDRSQSCRENTIFCLF